MIKIASAQGFTTAEIQKLQSAIDLLNRVMVSDDFKAGILEFEFDSTNDTALEVYQRLTGQDWAVDFSIVTPPWYKRWFSKEVAHECTDGSVVFDRNKFSAQSLPSVANTALHETCHKAKYGHASAHDYNSVPYGAGNEAEQVANRIVAGLPPLATPGIAHAMAAEAREYTESRT